MCSEMNFDSMCACVTSTLVKIQYLCFLKGSFVFMSSSSCPRQPLSEGAGLPGLAWSVPLSFRGKFTDCTILGLTCFAQHRFLRVVIFMCVTSVRAGP